MRWTLILLSLQTVLLQSVLDSTFKCLRQTYISRAFLHRDIQENEFIPISKRRNFVEVSYAGLKPDVISELG